MGYYQGTAAFPSGPVMRSRRGVALVAWIAAAACVAVLEALAATLDWKLGLAVAVALIVGGMLLARPFLLVPVAMVTVLLEGLTFGGAAVTRLVVPGAFLVVAAELLRGSARIRVGPPLFAAGAYVVWAIASGLWTESTEGTMFLLQSLGISLVFLAAFASMINTEAELRLLLYVLSFSAALIGGLSVIAFGGSLEVPYLPLLQGGRSQGGVGDPDFFASMQLVFVPLALVLASEERRPAVRIALYFGILTLLASAFTSLSRGAYLGTVVLGILFLASRPERLFRARHEKAVALVVVALGMVAFFSRPFVRDEVVTRARSIYAPANEEEASGAGRTNLWMAAAKTAGENPLTGVGFGSFKFISQELILRTPGVNPEILQIREEGNNFAAHNTYLGTAAELGFTGLFLYVGILLVTFATLRRTSREAFARGSPFVGRVAHALLLGLAVWAVTTFFLSGETARTFWIIVGLSLALPKLIPEPPARTQTPLSVSPRSHRPVVSDGRTGRARAS
jgi:O-antigen ligase